MTTDDALADPKAIGEDVEQLTVDAVAGLEAADARDDWFDARTVRAVGPRTADGVVFAGISIIPANTHVEIKAAQRTVSNGSDRTQPGRWYFKRDQHDQLLAASAVYLVVLYEETESARKLDEIVAAPASIVDECVRGRWYDVDRRERQVAQLAWPQVLGGQGGASP